MQFQYHRAKLQISVRDLAKRQAIVQPHANGQRRGNPLLPFIYKGEDSKEFKDFYMIFSFYRQLVEGTWIKEKIKSSDNPIITVELPNQKEIKEQFSKFFIIFFNIIHLFFLSS